MLKTLCPFSIQAYYLFVYRDFVEKMNYNTFKLYVTRAIHILNQHTSIFFMSKTNSVLKYEYFSFT